MAELKVAFIQTDIYWEDSEANLKRFRDWTKMIRPGTDLIILPEMFATGFSTNPLKCAIGMDSDAVEFMKETASSKKAFLIGSLLISEKGKYYNRCIVARPSGEIDWYDKKHLFRMSDEYKIFTGGKDKMILKIRDWKIQPMVCYDLRFPVWTRNTFSEGTYGYDLQVFVANWPESRIHAWRTLLTARAIENLSYVIGVNRLGPDGFGTLHPGESLVIDPKGKILLDARSDPGIYEITLQMEDLITFRKSFPVAYDWDLFRMDN